MPECWRNHGLKCLLSMPLVRPCSQLIFEIFDSQKWGRFSDLEIVSSDFGVAQKNEAT